MRHTSQCFGRFLRVKVCVFSVFVFCFVSFFACFLVVSLFVFSFFLGRDGGQYSHSFINLWHLEGGDLTGPAFSPHISLGSWIPRCGFPIPDSGFQGLAFPDSFGCILDSEAQDSGFHRQKFPGIRIPDSLTVELDFALTVCKRPDFHGAVF